ncbi:redoxin domain-containing protein [Adhaeribacter radiodurans]|uniref:Redoxin domain-containing protein n=1 Tax=Adhaeribacter radiodurans TaxID=2745197 RepID=A0A7L7L7X8_9BACT|nr:redoxin domain-containing protein [Adhaeribacter radiodurans]QMU28898.1 redoxin domain-containing protein [Adhaeribacter radiodurans]
MKKIILINLLLLTAIHLQAQTSTQGQKVEPFVLQNETGQKLALADYASSKAVVVVFTHNHCPYSRLYKSRLQRLNSEYSGKGVTFLFVQPAISTDNSPGNDGNAVDKTNAPDNADFTYFKDTNQKVSQQLGATKTPEAVVLQPQNGDFLLRYKGAIDDNPQVEGYVKESYLKTALDAILGNQVPAVTQNRATGCTIKRF